MVLDHFPDWGPQERQPAQAPPPEPERHAGECFHCKRYTVPDDVWMELRHSGRVICLSCYYTITETNPRVPPHLRNDAIDAAGRD